MKPPNYMAALAILAASCTPQNIQQPHDLPAQRAEIHPTILQIMQQQRMQKQPSLTNDILYYMKAGELREIEERGIPDSRAYALRRDLQTLPRPSILSESDFEYYMAREKAENLRKTRDPNVFIPGTEKKYPSTKELKNHTPVLREEEWAPAYQEAIKERKQETRDPDIFR